MIRFHFAAVAAAMAAFIKSTNIQTLYLKIMELDEK
jgi:hypothetical protein